MATWDRILSRGDVEDRRGSSLAIGGGMGLAGLVLALLLNYFGGGDVSDVLNQLNNGQVASQTINSQEFEGADSYEVFVSTVLGSTNDMWSKLFSQNGLTYDDPKLVLFRGATQSSCGISTSQVGPHYCPADKTIYLDETFFNDLQTKLGAQGGDVAEAYVIAHEVGHHAQNELGIMDQVDVQDNNDSVRLELQADCFAGLWLNSIKDMNVFDPSEINEALDAAAAVGDDRIQKMTTGQVSPETWTHGSAQQRTSWFNNGYQSGSLNECNTFSS